MYFINKLQLLLACAGDRNCTKMKELLLINIAHSHDIVYAMRAAPASDPSGRLRDQDRNIGDRDSAFSSYLDRRRHNLRD